MIIMKFGGTSVQNSEAIRRVISIVRGRLAENPLVVVSALSKVTRQLCSIAEAAQGRREEEFRELLAALRKRHCDLAAELLPEGSALLSDCLEEIGKLCDELEDFVYGVYRIAELSPRSYARIVSTGELLSSVIVSAAMNADGLSCHWADARRMMVTDCNYMSAAPDLEATEANVRREYPALSKGASVVLAQGFIASSVEGFPSVLGFEGSDYSAAIFGMALNASRVEIWTDVDGIRTADPRIVSNTGRIDRLSYDEAAEMATLGARVLHPLTIGPARKRGIPVVVLNSSNPGGQGSEVSFCGEGPGPKSIALNEEVEFVKITSTRGGGATAILADVYDILASEGLKTGPETVSGSSVNIVIEIGKVPSDNAVRRLREKYDVQVSADKALVSVVGRDVASSHEVLSSLLQKSSPVYMLSASPAMLSVSVVVDKARARDIVIGLHSEFFG
ncbi:MAG: aspartate kinase [Candidatus Cryptobacteroides sp.]